MSSLLEGIDAGSVGTKKADGYRNAPGGEGGRQMKKLIIAGVVLVAGVALIIYNLSSAPKPGQVLPSAPVAKVPAVKPTTPVATNKPASVPVVAEEPPAVRGSFQPGR